MRSGLDLESRTVAGFHAERNHCTTLPLCHRKHAIHSPGALSASHRAVGCDACQGLGYTDERILVCESMPFSDRLQQLVIEKASESEVQAEAVQEGMTTLLLDGPRCGAPRSDYHG